MIKSQITLKQLEAFVCVVDMGSFRKAAQVLGTTQPNISNRIGTLEQSLDVVLMYRDPGSVRVSEKGRNLLAAARQVLWSTESFLEAAARTDLIADRMRLGVTELVAATWLHAFLREFRAAYPAISVALQVDISTEIDKELASGQIDLALQNGPFAYAAGAMLPLETCRYAWVAAPELAADLPPSPEIAELLRMPLLIHARNSQAARHLARLAEANGVQPRNLAYASSLASVAQMAVDAMGVTLVPERIIRDHLAAGRLVALACDWHPDPLEFFARFDPERAPRFVQTAADMAIRHAAEDGGRDH